jgi:hypothetical protein
MPLTHDPVARLRVVDQPVTIGRWIAFSLISRVDLPASRLSVDFQETESGKVACNNDVTEGC